jgi:hypothetical protein
LQKHDRIRTLPLRIGRREQGSNIGSRNRTEESIGNGMQKNIAIGMAAQTFVVVELHASDQQWNAGLEGVRVPAKSDARCQVRWVCFHFGHATPLPSA